MPKKFFITTAIDYPNSRPHIGTAFEKIGADVQARYRRMEGYDVHFLMGNDENTIKVAKRAAELKLTPKEYCDDMARQFQEVWRALEISYDEAMLEYHLRAAIRLQEHEARLRADGSVVVTKAQRFLQQYMTTQPLDRSRVQAWRKAMNIEEREQFNAIAGHLLRALGYETHA